MKIPRRHLADYVIKLHLKTCRSCGMIIFSLQPIKQLICSVVAVAAPPVVVSETPFSEITVTKGSPYSRLLKKPF